MNALLLTLALTNPVGLHVAQSITDSDISNADVIAEFPSGESCLLAERLMNDLQNGKHYFCLPLNEEVTP